MVEHVGSNDRRASSQLDDSASSDDVMWLMQRTESERRCNAFRQLVEITTIKRNFR